MVGIRGSYRIGALLPAALLALAGLTPAPAVGQIGDDPTPNSDAWLVAEPSAVQAGQPFTVGVHITLKEGWHTYWKNAGDAGSGTIMEWDLPDGFSVTPLRYPIPERIPYPPLMSYGYHDEVVLLATVTPPATLNTDRVAIDATADFLVCEDVCVPATATIGVELPVTDGTPAPSEAAPLIEAFRDRLPVEDDDWSLRAARTDSGFVLAAMPPSGWGGSLAGVYFFPDDGTILTHTETQDAGLTPDGTLHLMLPGSEYMMDEPDVLEGILVLADGQAVDAAGHQALEVRAPVDRGPAAGWAGAETEPLAQPQVASATDRAGAASQSGAANLSLLAALLGAFLGGLILNLMPCVFPILSLKALTFANRGGDRVGMRRDGLAFGAGVVLSFLAVAGILIAVRAGGAEVGWGYQLQSPTVVALLAALMFGLGLWLAGVVELGASLTRLGGLGGLGGDGEGSSFMTGVLATVVATPCTAPFMGAAVGAAMVRPIPEALAIFAGLGVGMASPYVALSFWPAMARRLPKPGRWMETFKQVLAFPMFAVVVWLVWVFGLQVGVGGATRLLFGLLLLALASWLVGRWPATAITGRVRAWTRGLALVALLGAVLVAAGAVRSARPMDAEGAAVVTWEPWTQTQVDAYRAQGRPVFVDFTAAWCISCQVNERVALGTRKVRAAFAGYDIALLKADWTRRDPAITQALADFGRVGVPLYVLYPADPAAEPRVLPELLTPDIVLNALRDGLGEIPDRTEALLDE